MRLYKPTYVDRKTHKTRTVANFYIEARDHNGRLLRLPAFTDKRASETLARNLQRIIDAKAVSDTLPAELAVWVQTLPPKTISVLTRWGLLEPQTLAGSKPLSEHIADWEAHLLAQGNTRKHANLSASRIQHLTKDCGFTFFSDIAGSKAVQKLAEYRGDRGSSTGQMARRGMGIKTTNYYLRDMKSFCRWMQRERRCTGNPVEHLTGQKTAADIRRERRTLSVDDMRGLLDAAHNGPSRCGIPGPERALIYNLAATTGLRVSEIASLTVGSFTFGDCSSVTIAAAYAKNRRKDTLPLQAQLAENLQLFLAGKMPDAKVFPKLNNRDSADMVKADMRSVGLPYEIAGKVFDFHALRHQFISGLAEAGVHPKAAQQLARHSTISLTMDRYTHLFRADLSQAIDSLPKWDTPPAETQKAEGIVNQEDTQSCWARCWARQCGETRSTTESGAILPPSNEGEENPLLTREICDNQSNSDKGRSGIRTHESRICNPLP